MSSPRPFSERWAATQKSRHACLSVRLGMWPCLASRIVGIVSQFPCTHPGDFCPPDLCLVLTSLPRYLCTYLPGRQRLHSNIKA